MKYLILNFNFIVVVSRFIPLIVEILITILVVHPRAVLLLKY